MQHRRAFILGTGVAIATFARHAASAEAPWPGETVRLLVAAAPGGVPDVRARWLAERLGPALGRAVVVENRPAIGGAMALAEGARAAGDGSVVIFAHQGVMTITPHLQPQLGYDPLADFKPVTRFGAGALALVVHPDVPARNFAELLQLAKSRADGLRYASAGIGTPPHLATELLLRQVGLAATHIPYKGGADAQRAVIGAQVDFQLEALGLLLPQIKAGRLRPIAVSSPQRAALLPEVPTLAEAGAVGYEYLGWTGVVMPRDTAPALVQRLALEIGRIAQSADGQAWFAGLGAEARLLEPDAFAALIRTEYARHGRLIRDAGIRLE